MRTAIAVHPVEGFAAQCRALMGITLKFVGAVVLGSVFLGTVAQTQQSAEKQRLTVMCYWQNFQETIFLHLAKPGSGLYHDGCELYEDATHCERTVDDMLRDSKHDWERVTAQGFIYTISCRRNCKELPHERQSYEVETDGKWMWITFEKPDRKDLVETFEVTDISAMKKQETATSPVQSNPFPASPQPSNSSQNESGVSDADVEALDKLLELEPPQFCDGAPLLSKLIVGTMASWKSALDSESLADKIQVDSEFEITETKLWKCSHSAVMRNDGAAFQQALLALALVEQMHLAVRRSSLDDAVNSMTTLSSAVTVPAKPSVSQRVGVAVQGVMNGLSQWAEYQRQLRLARVQNQIHCTTTTWGRTTYTDCY